MWKKTLLILSLAVCHSSGYAVDSQVPWRDPRHDAEFKYLQERSPELEELWDGLGAEEQKSELTTVREVSAERYEQVSEYYQKLIAKWDVEALKCYVSGVSPGDMQAFQIWLGPQKVQVLQKKLDLLRYVIQKAEKEGFTDDEVLALEPYIKTDVIDALRHAKFSKEIFNEAPPRDYLANGHSSSVLRDLAGKPLGLSGGKDLSMFYDGKKQGGDSALGLTGAGAAELNWGKVLSPEARNTSATTIKHSVPGSFGGEDGGGSEPAPVVKSGNDRGLTADEIAAARTMYGDMIDYSKVRVITGEDMTLWGRILTNGWAAVTWGNTIYFPNDENNKSLYNFEGRSDWMVHEMGHVYQYQNDGWGYVPKSVWEQLTKGKAAYIYEIEPGKEFDKYGVEQQATIIHDYYLGAISPSMVPEVEKMLRKAGLLDRHGGN